MTEGLDVVDHRRIAEIAAGDRERRTGLGVAAQALAGRDQRAFLAADVGAGAHLDADVEVEVPEAHDLVAEQAGGTALLEHVLEQRAQIGVFAAQVEDAFLGADGAGGDGHALDQQVRPLGEQHPVLERAGLAFVGVADDEAPFGLAAGGEAPLAAGDETGAAATAQAAFLDRSDDLGRSDAHRLVEAGILRHRTEQRLAGMADVVVDHAVGALARRGRREARNRDLLRILAALQRVGDVARLLRRQLGDHDVVDHRCRRLVAHADARCVFEREGAVLGGLADLDAERRLELLHDLLEASEAVDDVVAQPDGDAALRRQREEGVEARHAFDLNPRQAGRLGDRLHGLRRNPAIAVLDRVQDIHHPARVVAVAGTYLEYLRSGSRRHVDRAGVL